MEAAEKPRSDNPLASASAFISILGMTICLVSVLWVCTLQAKRVAASEKIATTEYGGGDLTLISDSIGVGLTFFAQVVLYVVGGLVGGTLSLVGCVLGLAGLDRQPNRGARIGLIAGALGPLSLIGYLVLTGIL